MLHITLIRHGETDANRALRFQGHADIPLNAVGQLQARRLAAALRQQGLLAAQGAAYASDLQRAVQTAQLALSPEAASSAGVALPPEPAIAVPADSISQLAVLREQSFGVLEGLTFAEAQQAHPDSLQQWLRFDPDFALPQGESLRDFHRRVMQALTDIAAQHHDLARDDPQRRVLVFTHGGVIDMVWRELTGQPLAGPRTSEIPNVGLNHIGWTGDTFRLLQWADARHVADLPAQPRYEQRQYASRP